MVQILLQENHQTKITQLVPNPFQASRGDHYQHPHTSQTQQIKTHRHLCQHLQRYYGTIHITHRILYQPFKKPHFDKYYPTISQTLGYSKPLYHHTPLQRRHTALQWYVTPSTNNKQPNNYRINTEPIIYSYNL